MVLATGDQAMAQLDVLHGRVRRASPRVNGLDCSEIVPGVWQGAKPPKGRAVSAAGFDVLVLCAAEYQPSPESFPGVKTLVSVPLWDDFEAGPDTLRAAQRAGKLLAERWLHGQNLLITCAMGLNRSGLVTGMTLRRAFPDVEPRKIANRIIMKRMGALSNPRFHFWVSSRFVA